MKAWPVTLLLLLSACAGVTRSEDVGTRLPGAQYADYSPFGGTTIYVYPSGSIVREHWFFSKRRRIVIMDRKVWAKIKAIVAKGGGVLPVDESTTDGALCDAGAIEISARVGDKTAYYVRDNNGCEQFIQRSDAAGRKMVDIFLDLEERFDRLTGAH